ncbi:MAG: hypothetical protein RI930_415 [Pseudomonadota bacterium]|jgi:hypothetical protein
MIEVKDKTISAQFLEDKIPKLREGIAKFICSEIADVVNSKIDSKNKIPNKKNFNWQDVKVLSDVIGVVDKLTELIEQNKSLDVDLTNNDDILVDDILWTDDRLKEIPNYILPDLKEYTQYSKPNVKKKIKKQKIANL